MNINIFITLFWGDLLVYGMKEKQWISLIVASLAFSLLPLDYGFDTIFLLASLYLLRNYKKALCIVTTVVLGLPLFSGGDVSLFGLMINIQVFAVLAVPFIFLKTNFNFKINKYFFYCFYPVHLIVIGLMRLLISA